MNEQYNEDREQHAHNDHQHEQNPQKMLEARLTQFLQTQAAHIQFTPQLRNNVIQRLTARRKPASRRLFVLASVLAALLIVVSLVTYLSQSQQAAINYALAQTIPVPAELANGGQLISLDPTGHHFVYQPAEQPGVMYVANINNPLTSNSLAMRYAHDVAWSPDGTQLITTVSPQGTAHSLLALVRVGEYMNPLGPDALAASWSPTSAQRITYITQAHSQLQLWATTPLGHPVQLLDTMNVSLPVQHMLWSQDGQKLALTATNSNAAPNTQQPASAIYVMDAHTNALTEIVQPGNFSIGAVAWSPDKHYLTYEQVNIQGHSTLHIVDINQQKELSKLDIQKKLTGWSWSPDNRALVYSDGGMLHIYTLHGPAIRLPSTSATQYDPFWLKDGHILYLHITNGVGQLALLAQNSK